MWRWDIFCRVVDNYGDIGACWRLARQLAAEHGAAEHGAAENGAKVRLWVDDLPSFARLCPAVSTTAEQQRVGPIEVCRWRADLPPLEAADVVIEAFGCELPDSYLAAMMRRTAAPAWINLEYLSAEDWVEDCHRLPSLRTRCPIDKYFFFPGFTSRTGGLPRERDLFVARDAFDAAAEAEFWHNLGVPARQEDELRVLMFCYHNPALRNLLRHWAAGSQRVTVLATPGLAGEQVAGWLGEPLVPGTPLRRSSLTAIALPFLPHAQFDRLLWACDVNFVRGEDSFVRAQWARRPFVWQIYSQTEDAHWVKLDAFLARYLQDFTKAEVVRRLWQAWNGRGEIGDCPDFGHRAQRGRSKNGTVPFAAIASAWEDFVAHRQAVARHTAAWAISLDRIGSLADNLVSFARGILRHTRGGVVSPLRVDAVNQPKAEQDRNLPVSIVTAGELNPGNVVMVDKNPLVVMKKSITRSGRNAAICKLRLRNLISGGNSETVVKAEEKMEMVVLEKKECTYSYYAPPSHVFVDAEFNQYEIDRETISDLEKYLVPEMTELCELTFYEGQPISVVLPKIVVREVEYTEPAARGDTSGKIMKQAILKGTKHELPVSAFVEIGDMIEIDTTTDEFRGRCK